MMIERQSYPSLISLIKRWGSVVMLLAVAMEMIFFFSWENLAGCVMTLIAWVIFSQVFLKKSVILYHPFSFMMYLSMVMYRVLPLLATLLEWKPVTYGFENAFTTFFFETLLFVVSSFAFYIICAQDNRSNNILSKLLYSLGFFSNSRLLLWLLGFTGIAARLFIYLTGEIEYGNVLGKFAEGLTYLMYAPVVLLFTSLLNLPENNSHQKRLIWIYFAFLFVINIPTNSREAIILPFFTLALLFLVDFIKEQRDIRGIFTVKRVVVLSLSLVVAYFLITNVSLAMLATRSIRSDVDWRTLLSETTEIIQDKELIERLKSFEEESSVLQPYSVKWNEVYLDNFMLNRYGNMRITDQTLYHAGNIGYNNDMMKRSFYQKVLALIPTPFLKVFGSEVDKKRLEYSPGDLLYALGSKNNIMQGYRVTSHVGDGLATFGYWYFPLQFIMFFLVFKLLDTFIYFSRSGSVIYSPFALMNIFIFLGMFRNSNGLLTDVTYCLRGYWQGCITFLLISFAIRLVFKLKKYPV